VVALTDQWYMTYGEPEWQAATQQVGTAQDLVKLLSGQISAADVLQWHCQALAISPGVKVALQGLQLQPTSRSCRSDRYCSCMWQVLRSMKLYGAEKDFEAALDWLNQWACSRSFGLGTRCTHRLRMHGRQSAYA
jgi:hypothetical protein